MGPSSAVIQQHVLRIHLLVSGIVSQSLIVMPSRVVIVNISVAFYQETSSPPRSIPRPSTLGILLSLAGGTSVSKFSLLRASRAAADIGVLPAIGVRFHDWLTWAGLGDMLRKSAKFRLALGVCRPKPKFGPPPGVDIMDDGRGVDFDGGVDGGSMCCLESPGRAGDGEVAKCIRRPTSSSPLCPSLAAPAAVKPL